MKKQPLFPIIIAIGFAVVFFLGFFTGRNTAVHGTTLIPLSQSLFPTEDTIQPSDIPLSSQNRLDINTATKEDFAKLPGIGDTLAGQIVTYRDENGKFTSITDLLSVPGIGQKRLTAIETLICIGETP